VSSNAQPSIGNVSARGYSLRAHDERPHASLGVGREMDDPERLVRRVVIEQHAAQRRDLGDQADARGTTCNKLSPASLASDRPINADGSPYSINSSARTSMLSSIVRPIALAVLRLIASSSLVGNCTGSSLILAPRKMRSR
jgi:hypothetical protein